MTETAPVSEDDSKDLEEFVKKNYWKIRQCEDYLDEYKECSSLSGRFQQYFVDGEFADCSPWKVNYKNCEKAQTDFKAAAAVIRSEEERRQKRLQLHLKNDVWKRRDKPPSNWDSELPDFMQENQKNSFKIAESGGCVIS